MTFWQSTSLCACVCQSATRMWSQQYFSLSEANGTPMSAVQVKGWLTGADILLFYHSAALLSPYVTWRPLKNSSLSHFDLFMHFIYVSFIGLCMCFICMKRKFVFGWVGEFFHTLQTLWGRGQTFREPIVNVWILQSRRGKASRLKNIFTEYLSFSSLRWDTFTHYSTVWWWFGRFPVNQHNNCHVSLLHAENVGAERPRNIFAMHYHKLQ